MSNVKFAQKLRSMAEASNFYGWCSIIEGAFQNMEAEAKKGKFELYISIAPSKELTVKDANTLQEKFLTEHGLSLRFHRCTVEIYVDGVTVFWN